MRDTVNKVKGFTVEYYDNEHVYLVDGVMVPSITQIIKDIKGVKYKGVPKMVLQKAAEKGTQVHEAIEKYCKTGIMEDLPEVKNFSFLQKKYKFKVLENETPVLLFNKERPIAAGRLDLVLEMGGLLGGADIKRTYVLDKDYVALQLNLYRIAYRQSYGKQWEFLRAVHLRENKRRFVNIPIDEELTMELLEKWRNCE